MTTYIKEFLEPYHRDRAERIITEKGGVVFYKFKSYECYCIGYSATEEQEEIITKRINYSILYK